MTKRTRVFLFASAGVLVAGLATGLVAWAAGAAAVGSNGPDELAYVPGTASMVAYADVRQVMNSPFRDRFGQYQRGNGSGPYGIEARTGIDFERDIDRVLIASLAGQPGPLFPPPPGAGAVSNATGMSLLVARGRFDTVRIEGLMRQQGAQVEEYRGKRLVSIKDDTHGATLAFVEPGLVLFGARDGVRGALDVKAGAANGIAGNRDFMTMIDGVDEGTAWSVAKFDSLAGSTPIPSAVVNQLPPINWLAASGRIDSGLHGLVRAEAQDEQAAQSLREVVQGFLALARLQSTREPAYKGMLDSVALNADGKSVSLSFEVTPAALDLLAPGNAARRPAGPRRP
ncbi:MAG TPA: hypothetical protein VN654_06840 [Vicinamibacterales bacterium]|jgi:hypothetical protein|nr:hypothetical protein [Vicinamibacterales bacterium]